MINWVVEITKIIKWKLTRFKEKKQEGLNKQCQQKEFTGFINKLDIKK